MTRDLWCIACVLVRAIGDYAVVYSEFAGRLEAGLGAVADDEWEKEGATLLTDFNRVRSSTYYCSSGIVVGNSSTLTQSSSGWPFDYSPSQARPLFPFPSPSRGGRASKQESGESSARARRSVHFHSAISESSGIRSVGLAGIIEQRKEDDTQDHIHLSPSDTKSHPFHTNPFFVFFSTDKS